MSLHLVIEDPSQCPTCEGEGRIFVELTLSMDPCPVCYCEVCGDTTETAPLCARCDIAQDAAYERGQDR